MSDTVWYHRQQPARLPLPWDSPGKNTGVGCHFLLQCVKVKSESEVAQSCLTLSDPMDLSLPGSSIRGIFQARVLEWVAIAFSGVQAQRHWFSNNKVSIFFFTKHYICSLSYGSSSSKPNHQWPVCASTCVHAQWCLTLCGSMNCSPPGSYVPGILQARILEWVAISFSRGSSWPSDQTQVVSPPLSGRFFSTEPPGKPQNTEISPKTLEECEKRHTVFTACSLSKSFWICSCPRSLLSLPFSFWTQTSWLWHPILRSYTSWDLTPLSRGTFVSASTELATFFHRII